MNISHLRIATRQSPLALAQTQWVKRQLLNHYPELTIEIVALTTTGDRFLEQTLQKVGGKGLFVKELETALLNHEADIAVHSMKDLPSELASDFHLAAICKREAAHDVLVSRHHLALHALPKGSIIGTSSLRRVSQVKALRADFQTKLLRGNVNSRLTKLWQGEYDAIVLAYAGLKRLNFDQLITYHFDPTKFIPAVGQGALGVECRASDHEIIQFLQVLHHEPTASCVLAERAMNAILGGSCHIPIGGYAMIAGDHLVLHGFVGAPTGQPAYRTIKQDLSNNSQGLGQQVAYSLINQGANQILNNLIATK